MVQCQKNVEIMNGGFRSFSVYLSTLYSYILVDQHLTEWEGEDQWEGRIEGRGGSSRSGVM